MKKTKNIPAIVTLLGSAVAVIVTYINGYGLEKMLKVLLIVIFIFLFIGLIIKHLFEKYIPPIEEEEVTEEDEGSVIEKSSDSEEGDVNSGQAGEPVMEESENV